jgi:serine/threonine-protein kinase
MNIAPGSRLGAYEVLELIAAGGMGMVFRARDVQLGRDVALKILPERFKVDAHRLARFSREARVLASLNHPNITTLYGIEALEGTHALVLELVDGETLAERVTRGPLRLADAIDIAAQIAAALEAAHEHGIVHRDLKPDNIKLRADGTVKVLDFGLAKMIDPTIEGTDTKAGTATAIDMGLLGAVLGTPAYMSPEQARGLPTDKRTDVWAFGCVLYEMLSGERAFAGERSSEIVAKIIEREPDFGALPADIPRTIRRLIQRCLEKDPRRRLRDLGDARLELIDAIDNGVDELSAVSSGSTGQRPAARGIAIAAVISAAVAGAAVWLAMRPDPAAPVAAARVTRFSITEPALTAAGLAISADGAQLAYLTDRGLIVRSRDRLDGTLVATRAVVQGHPFFSPDGQWVGFRGWDALRKAPAAGGPTIAVAVGHSATTGSWTGEHIVFGDTRGLFRVSADGGEALPLLLSDRIEQVVFPQMLPAREAVLFTVIPTRSQLGAANVPGARIEVLDLATGARRVVLHGGARPRYVPTGHLLYVSGATLYAVAFDLERLEARGDAIPMVTADGVLDFDVSNEGTLIYWASSTAQPRELVWVDRQGSEESLGAPARSYLYPRISPDGARVAIDVDDPEDRDVWIWDLRRSTLGRLTRDSAGNPLVTWSPDGRHLAFGSERSGVSNLFLLAADGAGEPERLLDSATLQMPISFAPDGRLLFSAGVAGQQRDIHALSLDTRQVDPLIHSPANELWAEVSPDGRWVAYDSDESGQFEVYVRPYPDAYHGGRWQISSEGGRQPVWSRDGGELFYRDFAGAVMASPVTLDPTFVPGRAVKVFDGSAYIGGGAQGGGRTYDVSPDGSRFLMVKAGSADQAPASLVVVLNWFEELKRLVPVPTPRSGLL